MLTPHRPVAKDLPWTEPPPRFPRGYGRMYVDHVTQADLGGDFDFLEFRGEEVDDPEIH